jgi:alanine dehydrogenase
LILGAGVVGSWAPRTAVAAGAQVTALDIDPAKLRQFIEHATNVATGLADEEAIGSAVAASDVVAKGVGPFVGWHFRAIPRTSTLPIV